MKFLSKILASLFLASFVACTTEPAPNNGIQAPTPTIGNNTNQGITDAAPKPSEPAKPTCKLAGSVLEGNMFWAGSDDRFVVISAEKETEDKELGESHRVLTVYDGSCKQLFREVLPVNFSADYPYYLSEITYNKVSRQVGIRGWYNFYLLDLTTLKLSAALTPKFLNERFAEDAQSGSIKRLELWENYMIGFAASKGPFVFDLANPAKPSAVLPHAEFAIVKGEQYNSLFLLKSTDKDNGYQAFLPEYDYEKEAFSLNILFEKPMNFDPFINKSFKNNRFILLKEKKDGAGTVPHAVDMQQRKIIDLPADLLTKKDTEIIAFLRKQNK